MLKYCAWWLLWQQGTTAISIFSTILRGKIEDHINKGSYISLLECAGVTSLLHNLFYGLRKAKVLIEELECLAEDVYSTTLTASLSILEASDCFDDDDNLPADSCEDEGQSVDPLDSAVSYSSVMILVHNMLKLDYSMQKFAILQEKIVKALCLKTPSSELDGYCLMWDLRPYIDDNVMQLAWKFIS
ncbi:hypothetical protein CFC21_016772 [Triticum aestivum]|uniref:Uncharacterized protein n=1 Tax=Triticum aestivum TaxID=4565 RepID=A0A9R1DZL5_WHEAT|nr:hypothetical protein CFC21_016772 [Triticum aestivum]